VARKGGIPLLVARRTEELEKLRAEIEAEGGRAGVYSVDLTSAESVDAAVKQMLADHDAIDMLVNNAGRSIRRSIARSYDRFHDFERTMALNYFAPVRLVLRLLPHMTERRFGHIINARRSACRPTRRGSRRTSRRSRRWTRSAAWPRPRWSGTGSRSPTSTCRWCARR
jgi:short-subunit dehydrogenase